MALDDYKDIVGGVAAFVTYCQMFSGVSVFSITSFLCKDIYKKKSTDNIPTMPFMGGLVISVLFYQHSLLLNDSTMIIVNVGGCVLNICYLLFYFLWTKNNKKSKFYADVSKGVALTVFLLLYVQIEDPKTVEFRFGMIITVLLLSLIASPLFSLGEVIRTQSTESLPFPIIFSGFVVSVSWLLYGIIIKNNFVIFQNIMGTLLGLIQLSLFLIYPSKTKIEKKVQ